MKRGRRQNNNFAKSEIIGLTGVNLRAILNGMETQTTPPDTELNEMTQELRAAHEKAASLECAHRLSIATCYGRPERVEAALQMKSLELIGLLTLLTGVIDKDSGEHHQSPFLKIPPINGVPLNPILEKLLAKKRVQFTHKAAIMLTGHLMALAANLDIEAMKATIKPCGEEGCTCHVTEATALETLSLFKQYVMGQEKAGKLYVA